MGLFDRLGIGKLKEGLAKTREGLVGRVARILGQHRVVDEEVLERIEESLIAADVGLATSSRIMDAIRETIRRKPLESSAGLMPLLKEEIEAQFSSSAAGWREDPYALSPERPYVVMIVGINGVGKTTTIGKLAHNYMRAGHKVYIAAADTFRAAANEQLEIWAARAGATLIQQKHGADPASVAFDAVKSAAAQGADVVLIDTAGRLHTRVNLMEELKKVRRVVQKQLPAAPHEVLLVIDASTGQNGIQQARQFSAAVGVTGLVLTKLDGTAKGGIVLAIVRELNIPVRFVGVGEKLDDLQPFDPRAYVEALFET
jgi:fused signal recognition particle receptor